MEARGRQVLPARLRQVHPRDRPGVVPGVYLQVPEPDQQHVGKGISPSKQQQREQ